MDSGDFNAANRVCQQQGMTLTKISSQSENLIILALVPSGTFTWLGANYSGTTWLWLDNSGLSYSFWASGQPVPTALIGTAIRASGSTGLWYNSKTGSLYSGSLCSAPVTSMYRKFFSNHSRILLTCFSNRMYFHQQVLPPLNIFCPKKIRASKNGM